MTLSHTHTGGDGESVRAPCPVICCNLELWQFTDFGVELVELAVCSRSFQPPVAAGNNSDTPKIFTHVKPPRVCTGSTTVVNISANREKHGGEYKPYGCDPWFASATYSSFSKQDCWELFNSLSSLRLFVSHGIE